MNIVSIIYYFQIAFGTIKRNKILQAMEKIIIPTKEQKTNDNSYERINYRLVLE